MCVMKNAINNPFIHTLNRTTFVKDIVHLNMPTSKKPEKRKKIKYKMMWKYNKKGKLKGYIDYNEIPYVIKVKKLKII